MKKVAVFPGSFDPITNGHVNIIEKTLPLFDNIIVGIGNNSEKKYLFSLDKRKSWIEELFAKEPKIKVIAYDGLTVKFCREHNSKYIIRGVRNAGDFEFEKSIAQLNKTMSSEIETVFFIPDPTFSFIASSIVREIIKNNGDIRKLVPSTVKI